MKAYSYIRWSSVKQTQGDSLRRQSEMAVEYAKKHNLELDTSTYQDHGISAFTGKNLVEGALGAFLKAVDEKRIKTPCYLLVEALDRITRAEIDVALELFLSIIRRGITIVVVRDEKQFSSETVKQDKGISLIIAIATLVQGYEDSKKRGDRVAQAWAAKRIKQTQGVIASAKGPAWLTLSEDKTKWIVNADKAAIVRRIFEMAIAGHGAHKIAVTLNLEGVKPLGRAEEWTHGNMQALLKQEAVFGRFRQTFGDQLIIDDYYPVIVSKTDFDAAQAGRISRQGTGGHNQGVSNLFSSISYCAYCGSRTKFSKSGPKDKKTAYLRCLSSITRGRCRASGMPYAPLEKAVLDRLINWQMKDLNPHELNDTYENLKLQFEEQIVAKQEELEKLLKLAMAAPNVVVIADRMAQAQEELDKLQADLVAMKEAPVTEKEMRNNKKLFSRLLAGDDSELRLQVQVAIRRQIEKIEILPQVANHPTTKHFYEDGIQRPGWAEKPIHVAKLTYVDGSERFIDVTPFLVET